MLTEQWQEVRPFRELRRLHGCTAGLGTICRGSFRCFSDFSLKSIAFQVLLLRSDPCEPASGPRWQHPSILRMASIFEEPLIGTTTCFRKGHFEVGLPSALKEVSKSVSIKSESK